jgi:hypothetical protein
MDDHTYSSHYVLELGLDPEDIFQSDDEVEDSGRARSSLNTPEPDHEWEELVRRNVVFSDIHTDMDHVTSIGKHAWTYTPDNAQDEVGNLEPAISAMVVEGTLGDPTMPPIMVTEQVTQTEPLQLVRKVLSSGKVLGVPGELKVVKKGGQPRIRLSRAMGKELRKAKDIALVIKSETARMEQWLGRLEKMIDIQQDRIRMGRVKEQAQNKIIRELRQQLAHRQTSGRQTQYTQRDLENM